MTKILITGIKSIEKLKLAQELSKLNDDLSISPVFTTEQEYEGKDINEQYLYYMDVLTVNLSYKNNSLFFVTTDDDKSKGVTIDDFYNNDIFILTIEEFNTLPTKTIMNEDLVVVWLDSKYKRATSSELCEVKYFQETLEQIPYLYFIDEETENIAKTILKYVNSSSDEEKQEILSDNN